LLNLKAKVEKLSFSVVDHLRWDLSQIIEMAVAEGHIRLNPARLLFTPREAKKPVRRAMTSICSMIGGTLTSLYDFFLDTPPFLILRFNG
jgi:nitrate reductase alpha subunit